MLDQTCQRRLRRRAMDSTLAAMQAYIPPSIVYAEPVTKLAATVQFSGEKTGWGVVYVGKSAVAGRPVQFRGGPEWSSVLVLGDLTEPCRNLPRKVVLKSGKESGA